MSRPLRIEYPGAWYHVMNRGANYKNIFTDDDDREMFLQLIEETNEIQKIIIHAYCLMDNHYHLLVKTPEGGLGRAMRHLNGVYTQRFNRKNLRDGPLFRGRYKAIVIDKEAYLLELVRYIHMNPAKNKNDIHKLLSYPWSSNIYYLGKKKKPNWLKTSNVLCLFSANPRDQRFLYKEFITDRIPEEIRNIYSKKKLSPILGDLSFREWVKRSFVKDQIENYEIPEANKKTAGPTADQVLKVITKWYKVDMTQLKVKRRGVGNEPRQVGIYLCRHLCGLSLKDINSIFSLDAYTTTSMAIAKVKKNISGDKSFKDRVEKIKSLVSNKQSLVNCHL